MRPAISYSLPQFTAFLLLVAGLGGCCNQTASRTNEKAAGQTSESGQFTPEFRVAAMRATAAVQRLPINDSYGRFRDELNLRLPEATTSVEQLQGLAKSPREKELGRKLNYALKDYYVALSMNVDNKRWRILRSAYNTCMVEANAQLIMFDDIPGTCAQESDAALDLAMH